MKLEPSLTPTLRSQATDKTSAVYYKVFAMQETPDLYYLVDEVGIFYEQRVLVANQLTR